MFEIFKDVIVFGVFANIIIITQTFSACNNAVHAEMMDHRKKCHQMSLQQEEQSFMLKGLEVS